MAGATGYSLYIRDLTTNTLIFNNDGGAKNGTNYVLPAGYLSNNGHAFRWAMGSFSAAGESAQSSYFYFQTPQPNVGPPTLLAPGTAASPGPVLATLTPTFNWNAVAGATGYSLYIRDLTTNTLIFNNDGGAKNGTNYVLPAGYLSNNGHAFRWAMGSFSAAGESAQSSYFYFQTPQPNVGPPPLLAPGDAASPGPVLATLTPTFNWNAVAGATGYSLYIRDLTTNTLIFNNDGGAKNGTNYVLPAGYLSNNGHAFRWAMGSFSAAGESAQSSYFYFQTPQPNVGPPTLLAPGTAASPGPVLATLTPTFNWNAVAGATGYSLYIRDLTTNTLIFNNDGGAKNGTNYVLPAGYLSNNGHAFRWAMGSFSAAGESAQSSYFYFQTPQPNVGPPTILAPGDAASPGPVLATLTPTFNWTAVAGATGYSLYIRDLTTNTLIYNNDGGAKAGTNYVLPAGILTNNGHAFRWAMGSFSAAGESAQSSYLYFQTPQPNVGPPTILAPGGAASPGPVLATLTPTFNWTAVPGATGYSLYIRDLTTNTLIFNNDGGAKNGTNYVLPAGYLSNNGHAFRWAMGSFSAAGESAQSSYLYFQTPQPNVGPPTILAPGDTASPGPVLTTLTPTFNWTAVAGATGYSLYIRDLTTNTLIYNNDGGAKTGTNFVLPTGILSNNGHAFRWAMGSFSASGESAQSSYRYFQTSTVNGGPPIILTPGDTTSPGPILASLTPTFTWSAVAGATGYSLYIRDLTSNTLIYNNDGGAKTGTSFVLPAGVLSNNGHAFRWAMGTFTGAVESVQSSYRYFQTPSTGGTLLPPNILAPGDLSSPGPVLASLTPTFSWNAVAGASGYGLYIRDLTTNTLVFDNNGGAKTGQSFALPLGILTGGRNYRWAMTSFSGTSETAQSGYRYFTTQATGSDPGFYLSFPLAGLTHLTAPINSVFDHTTASGSVVAYTGERGDARFGESAGAYKQDGGGNFNVNGNYTGAGTPNYLNYDGHEGIDYRTKTTAVPSGNVDVFAAADGIVMKLESSYGQVFVNHENGYRTAYVHLQTPFIVSVNQRVTRGMKIGTSGSTSPTPIGAHLHFELQKLSGTTWIPVDPYGWKGTYADPYTLATSVDLWSPSNSCSFALLPSSRTHTSPASAGTFTVSAGASCTWSATSNAPWISLTGTTGGTGSGAIAYSITANTSATARVGTIGVQGQSFTITQGGVSPASDYPNAIWSGPVATGNFESGRSGNSITKIVVHTIEGTAQSGINAFKASGTQASAHYIVGSDGTVHQMLAEADTAYHCGNISYNRQSIGIELEGWADGNPVGDFSWQTAAQFNALQGLVTYLASRYTIPIDRAHLIGHNQVPSPGTAGCPPSSQWGGCSNHYDTGASWNWLRLMSSLGRPPVFQVVTVTSSTSIRTLPQSDGPIINPATIGQKFVAYDSNAGYLLVFLAGKELPQQGLTSGGEFHWDGWIPASAVSTQSSAPQVEIAGSFPGRVNIRSSASLSAAVIGRAIDGKRFAATGRTQSADGFQWLEVYISSANVEVAKGWVAGTYASLTGDSQGPAIAITSPSPPTYTSTTSTVSLSGTASDDTSVASVTWVTDHGAEGVASGTSNWSIANIPLIVGQTQITVTAIDAAGNSQSAGLTVSYSPSDTTSPTIQITSPGTGPEFDTTSPNITIGGTSADDVGIASITWQNNRGGAGSASGTANWTAANIALQIGDNQISVTAADAAGNATSDTILIRYQPVDQTPPTVHILTPTTNPSYASVAPTITLSGTASDETNLASVKWSSNRGGSGDASGTSAWTVLNIPLQDGVNIITVTARDLAGNAQDVSLSITYAVPVRMKNPVKLPGGPMEFQITGPPGKDYLIRASTDMNSWFYLKDGVFPPSGEAVISDPNRPNTPSMFYRIDLIE